MHRFLPQGLTRAGQHILDSLSNRTIQVPISEDTLGPLVSDVDDPTVRDLRIRIRAGARLELSGLKKKGLWVPFSASFRAAPPEPGEPGQALDLYLETAEPFFARGLLLKALAAMDELEVDGERVRVRLDHLVARQDWARAIPEGIRSRIRVTDVGVDEQQRLLLTFGWDAG